MKITFALPFSHLTGGIRAVFELSNALVERGHECFVASPHKPFPLGKTLAGKVKRKLFALTDGLLFGTNGNHRVDWFNSKFTFKEVRFLTDAYLPTSDYVIATNWRTASWVSALDKSRGKKRYLVFDVETWDRGRFPDEKVMETYRLIPDLITYSDFVAAELKRRANRIPTGMFTLGIDPKKFYPDPLCQRTDSRIRVCLMMRRQPHKGMEDGLKVVERVRALAPEVAFVGFGSREVLGLVPPFVEFHLSPNDDELRKIYSSCHIFLSSSKREGFNLPPMEAMACGCAVVATNTGAVSEYSIPGETVLMREPEDVDGLAKEIVHLIDHPNERKQMANRSLEMIKKYSWDNAAKLFEEALQNA